jgi:hypothetical protein
MKKMVRIQLDMPESQVKKIEAMMENSGIRTKKELFNVALSFLQWAQKEKNSGRIIASLDEKTEKYKEILIPGLG